jgi:hypothetical protein
MPTQWKLQASPVYDALCLLNIWTGDPFYTGVNPGVFEQWEPRLTLEVKTAFARLAKAIREEGQGIISAQLCLPFSALKPETLEDLILALDQPLTLWDTFQQTPYFDPKEWRSFERLFGDLRVVLKFLQAQRFEDEYRTLVAPHLEPILVHWREQLCTPGCGWGSRTRAESTLVRHSNKCVCTRVHQASRHQVSRQPIYNSNVVASEHHCASSHSRTHAPTLRHSFSKSAGSGLSVARR